MVIVSLLKGSEQDSYHDVLVESCKYLTIDYGNDDQK